MTFSGLASKQHKIKQINCYIEKKEEYMNKLGKIKSGKQKSLTEHQETHLRKV